MITSDAQIIQSHPELAFVRSFIKSFEEKNLSSMLSPIMLMTRVQKAVVSNLILSIFSKAK